MRPALSKLVAASHARRSVAAILGVGLLWIALDFGIARPLLKAAYDGTSWEFLNRQISGRHDHSYEHYESVWQAMSVSIGLCLVILVPVAVNIARGLFAAWRAPDSVMMSRRAIAVATCTMAVIFAVSTFDIVTAQEHWPFSNYPMYSRSGSESTYSTFVVVGVTEDGTEAKWTTSPLHRAHLAKAFRSKRRDDVAECLIALAQQRGQAAIADCVGIRVYRVQYSEDVAAGRAVEIEREVVGEALIHE
jgi:hypothetical protein